jgi:hypothetical protein
MSRLEDFLKKDKINVDKLKPLNNKYQCQTCDEFTTDSYLDESQYLIIWYCSQKHESKVPFV